MIGCKDELICDLAETYHIYDIKSLSPKTAAIFAYGLREDSRVKLKLSGQRLTFTETLSVMQYDKLNWLCWAKSKDAQKGRNRPEPLISKLIGEAEKSEVKSFFTAEDFERERERIMKGGL